MRQICPHHHSTIEDQIEQIDASANFVVIGQITEEEEAEAYVYRSRRPSR
jgi:hypothetical protein